MIFPTCRDEPADCSDRLAQKMGSHDDVIALCDAEMTQGTKASVPGIIPVACASSINKSALYFLQGAAIRGEFVRHYRPY